MVFDRGFGSKEVVELLYKQGATFYIRMKAGRYVELGGDRQQLKTLPKKDNRVLLYGLTFRIVRSPKTGKNDEPWYIPDQRPETQPIESHACLLLPL